MNTVFQELQSVYRYRDLLYNLIVRDIKIRSKQSLLGYLWILLPPFFSMVIYTVVISKFLGIEVGTVPYPVFVFCSLLPWGCFANTLTKGASSLVAHASLITHVSFPREVLPLAAVIGELFNLGISTILLLSLMIGYRVSFHATFLLSPVILGIQIVLTLGLTLFFSALNVYYRDVGYFVGIGLRFWMYLTPVIYSLENVPSKYRQIYLLNPMAPIIDAYRRLILEGTLPNAGYVLYASLIAVVMLIVGYVTFKKLEPTFADVI